jgi:hypothetical protein
MLGERSSEFGGEWSHLGCCRDACCEARTDGLARTIAFGVMSMSVAKEVSRGSRRPAAVLRPTGEDLARIYLDVLAVLMIQAATEDR